MKSRRFPLLTLLVVAALPASISGCVRLDLPPQQHPTLDTAQTQRQDAAIAAAIIADAARRAAPGTEEPAATVLQQIATQADAQRDALGDIWIAWPDGAPSEVSVPEPPDIVDETVTDAAGVLGLIHADWVAQRAAALSADTPEEQRATYVGVTVSRAAQATALAGVLEVPIPDATDPLTVLGAIGEDGAAALPLSFPGTPDGEAVAILDSARFGLETAAARSTDPVRSLAAQRADDFGTIAQVMVNHGVPDERRAAWASGDAGAQEDAAQMARSALVSVLPLWTLAAVEADEPPPSSEQDAEEGGDVNADGADEAAENAVKAMEVAPRAFYLDGACRIAMTLVQMGVPVTDPMLGPLPGIAEMGPSS